MLSVAHVIKCSRRWRYTIYRISCLGSVRKNDEDVLAAVPKVLHWVVPMPKSAMDVEGKHHF